MKHFGDITKIDGKTVPIVDIVVGGSPCQDLSKYYDYAYHWANLGYGGEPNDCLFKDSADMRGGAE